MNVNRAGVIAAVALVVAAWPAAAHQQAQPAPAEPAAQALAQAAPPMPEGRPIKVYLRAGLKTHAAGQHDYPQFLADWSKLLTERGAIVDGSLHFPTGRGAGRRRRHRHVQGRRRLHDDRRAHRRSRTSSSAAAAWSGIHDAICADDTGVVGVDHGRRQEARRDELHARGAGHLHVHRSRQPDHQGRDAASRSPTRRSS